MATKYTILETSETEESEPYSRKEYAVRDAQDLSEQYPGTEFAVATSSGKIVHKVMTDPADVVDSEPVDEVPAVQISDEDAFAALLAETVGVPADADNTDDVDDVDADFEPEGDADVDADLEPETGQDAAVAAPVVDATPATPAPALVVAPAAPVAAVAAVVAQAAPQGAELELCAANTNAKRMHYRAIGQTRTACGSANTSRRANEHQIETASLCPNCAKLATGKVVDSRPAGAARGGSGSRKAPKTLVIDAGEVRDLVAHLKQGDAFEMELTDGTRLRVVAGDPTTHEVSADLGDMQSIAIVAS